MIDTIRKKGAINSFRNVSYARVCNISSLFQFSRRQNEQKDGIFNIGPYYIYNYHKSLEIDVRFGFYSKTQPIPDWLNYRGQLFWRSTSVRKWFFFFVKLSRNCIKRLRNVEKSVLKNVTIACFSVEPWNLFDYFRWDSFNRRFLSFLRLFP